jgi:hypothetical protein
LFDFNSPRHPFQPRGGFLNLDAVQPELQQFMHRKRASAVWHCDDHAMYALLLDEFHQVRGNRVASYCAFDVATPTHYFNTQL